MRRFNPEKELYKIQHGGRNRVIAFVFLLLVVSVVSYSFALYQVRYSKRIIYTKVAPFSNKDIELAVNIKGEGNRDDFPTKEEATKKGYIYIGTECDRDGVTTVTWNDESWSLILDTKGPNKCTVTFGEPPLLNDYLANLVEDDLVEDDTQDKNIRYIGPYGSVNNYVWFNCITYDNLKKSTATDSDHKCERWRIIGLMKNVEIEGGTTENIVKIIRNRNFLLQRCHLIISQMERDHLSLPVAIIGQILV